MPPAVVTKNTLLNAFRLNAGRLGAMVPLVHAIIGSDWRHPDMRMDSLTMTDAINDEPNTMSFRLQGAQPAVGTPIAVALGTWSEENKIFAGQILSSTAVYEGRPENVAYDVQAIDHTWLLKRRLVSAEYLGQSATAIVQAIVQTFAGGYVANDVQPGLPVIDAISFENEDVPNALSRVMEAVGGYWYVDHWRSIHAFLNDPVQASAITTDQPNTMVNIANTLDLSQVSNRIYARGGGSQALADVPTGKLNTTIPVEDLGWYPAGHENGTNASGCWLEIGSQRASYVGPQGESGTGSVILGDTFAPGGGPAAVAVNVAGKLAGQYLYKTSFISKEGESMASPASAPVNAGLSIDGSAMTVEHYGNMAVQIFPTGATVRYVVTFVTETGESLPSTPSQPCLPIPPPYIFSGTTAYYTVSLQGVPIGPAGTTARRCYRSVNGGAFGRTMTIAGNVTTGATDATVTPGAAPPTTPTGGAGWPGQVDLSVIHLGPSNVTGRNLYRTVSGGSVFLKLATIRDNTTTTFRDNIADATLGDEEPTSGTLGTQPGSTELRVSALEAFVGYGWVFAANQLLYYDGRNPENGPGTYGPGALTGIPASGVGAITSPLSVNTEVMNAPHLVWVTVDAGPGLRYPVLKGDTVAILAIEDDATSQANMAAAVGFGDGVHELHIGDSSWDFAETRARARAELKRRKDGLVSITFETRDDSVWSGRDIYINVAAVGIAGWFKVRRVTFSQFGLTVWPLRRVEVTSQRFSFEDLLRQTRGEK